MGETLARSEAAKAVFVSLLRLEPPKTGREQVGSRTKR